MTEAEIEAATGLFRSNYLAAAKRDRFRSIRSGQYWTSGGTRDEVDEYLDALLGVVEATAAALGRQSGTPALEDFLVLNGYPEPANSAPWVVRCVGPISINVGIGDPLKLDYELAWQHTKYGLLQIISRLGKVDIGFAEALMATVSSSFLAEGFDTPVVERESCTANELTLNVFVED